MILLLTGGSGFLGSYLVPRLAPYFEKIYLLARGESFARYQKLFYKLSDIELVEGDLMHPDLFEDPLVRAKLEETVTHVLHAGALYDLKAARTQNYFNNVVGTQNVLAFMRRAQALERFHYISTIAVAGDFVGRFSENELAVGQNFKNSYAETKYIAEEMVRTEAQTRDLATTIYRLGILVADSQSGRIDKIDGPYYLLDFFEQNPVLTLALKSWALIPFPFSASAQVPLIPVDYAAKFIEQGVLAKIAPKLSCYHVVSETPPLAKDMLKDIFKLFGIRARPVAIPANRALPKVVRLLGMPESIVPYFYQQTIFDQSQLQRDFPQFDLGRYDEFKHKVLSLKGLKKGEAL